MTTLQGRDDEPRSGSLITEEYGPNTDFIKNAIPQWLINASPERRQAFRHAPTQLPGWYTNATPEQRQEMKRLTEASIESQIALDTVMARVQDIKAFAEPLLARALLERCNVTLDVNTTFLRLMKPLALGPLGIKVDSFPVLTLSLLDAALHNFEEFENDRGAFDSSSGFVNQIDQTGSVEAITTTLKPQNFIAVCRTLNIGQKYQDYLKSFLMPGEPVVEAFLARRFITCQKDALKCAACIALVKGDIGPNDYRIILSAIAGEKNIMNGNTPVWFWEPVILGKVLTGCLAFVTVEKYRMDIKEVILYIPHDPEHPVKKYANGGEELARRLLAAGHSPDETGAIAIDYAGFLSQFIAYKHRPYFFNRLTKEADDASLDPLTPLRSPFIKAGISFLGGGLVNALMPNELPPAAPRRRVPVTELDIRLGYRNREGYWAENDDMWAQLYQRTRDKILSDARSHAVPTADADAKTRADRISHLLEGAMGALNLVSMFVPVLGEVMLGVMAGQMMYETLEGVVEWSEGDREAAWAHFSDVAENLALMGVMAGGARIIKGIKPSPVVDSLKPVQLPSGETRLWKPDTVPYETNGAVVEGSVPNELGLYPGEDGEEVLPLGDKHYVVKENPEHGEYRIQHPSRPGAYLPLVEHNGEGAWVHEGEEPLSWEGPTLMRRLGYSTDAFNDVQLERIRNTSGVEPDQLRRVHVEQEPASELLKDTLTRFRIDQDIETFRRQMGSDHPADYAKADIGVQFKVIDSQELLPGRPPVRIMDRRSKILWDDPPGASSALRKLVIVMSDSELANGELLNSLLETFEAQGVDLTQAPGEPGASLSERATALRKEIARGVERRKATLFESIYRSQDVLVDASGRRIKAFFPQVPGAVINRIVEGASTQELAELSMPGPLPQRLYEQALWCQQELRVARAYEGFYLDGSANLDSQRLALRSLAHLPGWPEELRFELREYWSQGRLIDAVGAPDAPVSKVLVVGENGLYGVDASQTLYSATLQALSQDERLALGYTEPQAEALQQAVQQTPLPRDEFRDVLGQHREQRPSFDLDNKLLGGAGYSLPSAQEVASFFRTNRARIRKLYPRLQGAGVDTFLQSLGSEPRSSLARLEAEYATLKRELKTWVHANRAPGARPESTAQAGIAKLLKRAWRRETGQSLNLNGWVEPPALSAEFGHIESLTFPGGGSKARVDGFLKRFKNLKQLKINRGPELMTQIPDSVFQLKDLTQLNLEDHRIILTEQSASQLGTLNKLEVLNLNNNPLGRLPDFSGMPALRELRLSGTKIDQWPRGLGDKTNLKLIDLRYNRLREVPSALLNPPDEQLQSVARVVRSTLLEGNPFSAYDARNLWNFRKHLKALDEALVIPMQPGAFEVNSALHLRYRAIYPGLDFGQVDDYFLRLGSQSSIEAQVARLEAGYQELNEGLHRWGMEEPRRLLSWGPMVNGRARLRFRSNTSSIDSQSLARRRILECWRQRASGSAQTTEVELDLSGLRLNSLPELNGDFSHVSSINLSNMGLSVMPEAFFRNVSGLRALDLSNNWLTGLPVALDDLNGLTRLDLSGNRIVLTPLTARILQERTTLRALRLADNPLGIFPDFTGMTDLRAISLENTGLETWPVGLVEQRLIGGIDLSNNRIETLPPSVIAPSAEHLEQAARINNVTFIQGNLLSEATQQQLIQYWERLERERPDLYRERMLDGDIQAMEYRAPVPVAPMVVLTPQAESAFQRWTIDLPDPQLAVRRAQWGMLFRDEASTAFLSALNDLELAGAGHADLQRRVLDVIDSITEPNPESEALRGDMFEWAQGRACCDRAALTFSNVEIMAMVYRAKALAQGGGEGAVLLKLSRGLFRLDTVEKIALQDIDRRTAAINATKGWSAARKIAEIDKLEEVEIRLAYRFGLKDRLGLPGQPDRVHFVRMGKVTAQMLDQAEATVLALDNSPQEFQSLIERDFWKRHVEKKYLARFEAQREPYLDRQDRLDDDLREGKLTEAEHKAQSSDLEAQLQIEEALLIEALSRQELLENPF
jgi:Leucine-rich repeat (LRR) protein